MAYIPCPIWSDLQQSYVAVPAESSYLLVHVDDDTRKLPVLQKSIVVEDGESEDGDDDDELPEGVVELDSWLDTACRQLALMINEGDDDVPNDEGHNRFSYGRREWLVVTDDEADELWDQDLENYIDECILGELPEMAQNYFDREAWKKDARIDGRAHSLNRYDGNEECETINGEDYYIYRQN